MNTISTPTGPADWRRLAPVPTFALRLIWVLISTSLLVPLAYAHLAAAARIIA